MPKSHILEGLLEDSDSIQMPHRSWILEPESLSSGVCGSCGLGVHGKFQDWLVLPPI